MIGNRLVAAVALSAVALVAAACGGDANGAADQTEAVPAAARLQGVDVSSFQGEIDWPAVKASGIVFGFARASEGESIIDSEFASNWQAMKTEGVIRGAYHFYRSDIDPEAQVQILTSSVMLEPGDLLPVVDFELVDGSETPTMIADFQRFLDQVEKHYGVKPIIYTNAPFWNESMEDSFGSYPLWVADLDVDGPRLPEGWDDWSFWQHSQNGAVAGIAGEVYLNVFNGGLDDLARYQMAEGSGE